jgi:hypothetical protein
MAIKTGNTNQFTINSADTYVIGNAAQAFVGTYAVHLFSASFVGTIVIKGRSYVIGNEASSPGFVGFPYLPLYLNGAVGTFGAGSAVNITDTSYLLIPASGATIALDCTAYTSGEMQVYCIGQAGAAA